MNVLDEIGREQLKAPDQIPKFNVGDTVRVHFRIVEGEKERIQIFEGVVIGRKGSESPSARFTVRRLAYNEGVERVFPLHSPRVERVEIVREGHVRRAKLHYLRGLSGKAARVKGKARTAMKKAGLDSVIAPPEPEVTPEAVSETPPETPETEAAAEKTEEKSD